MREEDR